MAAKRALFLAGANTVEVGARTIYGGIRISRGRKRKFADASLTPDFLGERVGRHIVNFRAAAMVRHEHRFPVGRESRLVEIRHFSELIRLPDGGGIAQPNCKVAAE